MTYVNCLKCGDEINYNCFAWYYKDEQYIGLCLRCFAEELERMAPNKDEFLEAKYKEKAEEFKKKFDC